MKWFRYLTLSGAIFCGAYTVSDRDSNTWEPIIGGICVVLFVNSLKEIK